MADREFVSPTMISGIVDGLLVDVNAKGDIASEVWNDYLTWLEQTVRVNPKPATLTFAPAAMPNAKQRADYAELGKRIPDLHPRCMILISDSAVVRGAMTAMAWVTGAKLTMHALSPANWRDSFGLLKPFIQPSEAIVAEKLRAWAKGVGFTDGELQRWSL